MLGKDTSSPAEIVQGARTLLNANFELWHNGVNELDTLIRLRLASFAKEHLNDRIKGGALVAALLLAATIFAGLMLRSITRPLAALTGTVSPRGRR